MFISYLEELMNSELDVIAKFYDNSKKKENHLNVKQFAASC